LVRVGGEVLECELRGALRGRAGGSVVVAGDEVWVTATGPRKGAIEAVRPRRTKLARLAPPPGGPGDRDAPAREKVLAANVDRLLVVVAARDPEYKLGFIDRLLVAAAKGGLEPVVVWNKVDLAESDRDLRARLESDAALYRGLGVPALLVSARRGDGIEALRAALDGRIAVLAGPSGAGKSSLANALQPGLKLRTGEVSASTRKGRHVTTRVSLLPLDSGGYLVDTPGVRAFGFYDVSPDELSSFFPEFARHAVRCRFPDCKHGVEPACAVRAAVESGGGGGGGGGGVDRRRYESYRRILESLAEA